LDHEFLQIDELGSPRRPRGTVKLIRQIIGDAFEIRLLHLDLGSKNRFASHPGSIHRLTKIP